jgi:hypothetical protein
MEEAVSEDLITKIAKGLARNEAQKMMPLQDLVEQYPVEKAAEPDPKDGCGNEEGAASKGGRGHLYS